MDVATAKHVGARLLAEVEEESLEELISTVQQAILAPNLGSSHLRPRIPIPALESLIHRHHHGTQSAPPPLLSLSGRYLPFLYHLVSTLIASPHRYAVVVVDVDHRFDVTRLVVSSPHYTSSSATRPSAAAAKASATERSGDGDGEKEKKVPGGEAEGAAPIAPEAIDDPRDPYYPARLEDLKHVYVYRPARSHPYRGLTSAAGVSLAAESFSDRPPVPNPPTQQQQSQTQAALSHARNHMLYGAHASRDRRWWGSIVVGSSSAGGSGGGGGADVVAGWKGWLDIQPSRESEIASGFAVGYSLEEALAEREERRKEKMKGKGNADADAVGGEAPGPAAAALYEDRVWEGRCRWGVYSWGG
ncbi:hypothetical protein BX600DRAFT_154148 [Xylariales sp. PMI_506]|nr:hypothetical protein BX600DRAFT_154148 [Xylariales sp. PMI_506]